MPGLPLERFARLTRTLTAHRGRVWQKLLLAVLLLPAAAMADVDLIVNNEASPLTVIAGQDASYVVRVENGAGASETATAATVTHSVSSSAI